MRAKSWTALTLIAILLFGTNYALANTGTAPSAGGIGRAWPVPNDAERGMHVQWFMDSFPGESVTYLMDEELRKNRLLNPTCKGTDDPRCVSEDLNYSALLPTCSENSNVYCIEEFGIVAQNGDKTKAKFRRYFPPRAQNAFAGNPTLKLPDGSTGSIFNLPEAPHGGGDLYYVSVLTEGNVNKKSGANLSRFSIRIFPVALQPDWAISGGEEAGWSPVNNSGEGAPIGSWRLKGYGFSGNSFCVAGSALEMSCAQRYGFPDNTKYYLKIKTQVAPGGWMHGRIYSPDISISERDGNYTLEVAAYPVAVPLVYKMYQYQQMPQELKDNYDVVTGSYKPEVANWDRERINQAINGGCGRTACTADPLTRNRIISPGPSDPFGMDQLKLWIPFVGDKATALLGTWSMRTLDWNEAAGAERCFTDSKDGITGIVTTNATQYLAGPPKFNNFEQSLEYKVAAPHLTPRGEVFYGSYDLSMRSDVARCVYSFSQAPIKATISIIGDEGEQKIATEQLKEANGWVSLSASGFTYSSPVIKVKLTQDKPEPVKVEPIVEPTVTAQPTPTQEAVQNQAAKPAVIVKKKSITCVKGKMTKKVSGVSPKCPAGFKKK